MTPDFEQVKNLYAAMYDEDNPREHRRLEKQIDELVPAELRTCLEDLAADEKTDSPEFRRVFQEFFGLPVPQLPRTNGDLSGRGESVSDYDLLPFQVYDHRLGRNIAATGYEVDKHCKVYGTGGARRKRGPVGHYHFWRKRKGSEPEFFNGYRLTINGKRLWVTDRNIAVARYNAEKSRNDG